MSSIGSSVDGKPAADDIPAVGEKPVVGDRSAAAGEAGDTVLRFRFEARADRLRGVRERMLECATRCGCSAAIARDIVIAVDEACQNIIRHAYAGQEAGEVVLECRHVGDDLEVLLEDFARAVDPATIKPRELDDVRPGGLGVHFIRTVMDTVDFQPSPTGSGNRLRMTKKVR
jgi:sigma-B regulation protein RsbU (phosphoserine phosphatase)